MKSSQVDLDKAFTYLEHIAIAGGRCPVTSGPAASKMITSEVICSLARAGRVLIEIYAHNWRVVTILEGPHKGMRTAAPPYKYAKKPYQTVGIDGAMVNGESVDHSAYRRVSP